MTRSPRAERSGTPRRFSGAGGGVRSSRSRSARRGVVARVRSRGRASHRCSRRDIRIAGTGGAVEPDHDRAPALNDLQDLPGTAVGCRFGHVEGDTFNFRHRMAVAALHLVEVSSNGWIAEHAGRCETVRAGLLGVNELTECLLRADSSRYRIASYDVDPETARPRHDPRPLALSHSRQCGSHRRGRDVTLRETALPRTSLVDGGAESTGATPAANRGTPARGEARGQGGHVQLGVGRRLRRGRE